MGWISTLAINSAARWNYRDPNIHFPVVKSPLVRKCEESTLRDIRGGIDGIYKGDTKEAGMLPFLLELFKEGSMNNFLSLFLRSLMQKCRRLSLIGTDCYQEFWVVTGGVYQLWGIMIQLPALLRMFHAYQLLCYREFLLLIILDPHEKVE